MSRVFIFKQGMAILAEECVVDILVVVAGTVVAKEYMRKGMHFIGAQHFCTWFGLVAHQVLDIINIKTSCKINSYNPQEQRYLEESSSSQFNFINIHEKERVLRKFKIFCVVSLILIIFCRMSAGNAQPRPLSGSFQLANPVARNFVYTGHDSHQPIAACYNHPWNQILMFIYSLHPSFDRSGVAKVDKSQFWDCIPLSNKLFDSLSNRGPNKVFWVKIITIYKGC